MRVLKSEAVAVQARDWGRRRSRAFAGGRELDLSQLDLRHLWHVVEKRGKFGEVSL